MKDWRIALALSERTHDFMRACLSQESTVGDSGPVTLTHSCLSRLPGAFVSRGLFFTESAYSLQHSHLSTIWTSSAFVISFFFFFKPWFSLNELSHLKWPWTVCFPVHSEIPQVAPFRSLHFMHAYWLIYSILLYSFPGPKNTEIRWSWVLYKKWLYSLPSHFNFLLFLGSQDPQASRLLRLNICNPW